MIGPPQSTVDSFANCTVLAINGDNMRTHLITQHEMRYSIF